MNIKDTAQYVTAIAAAAGVIGGISTYRRLEPFTKHKDDIGTIRDT